MNREQLTNELIAAGAETTEAAALAEFENSLHKPLLLRDQNLKLKNAEAILLRVNKTRSFNWRRFFVPLGIAIGSLSLVGASAFAAQSSLPGDPLYSLKRVTETVLGQISPNFKNEIPLRRSEEVKSLIEKNKNDDLVKKSLEDYQKQAEVGQDKTNLERSRANLKEAETKASERSKEEINKVLEQSKVQGVQTQEKTNIDNQSQQKPTEKQNNTPNNSGEVGHNSSGKD